jgi:NitT/TauT family transport system substrate-binding protein
MPKGKRFTIILMALVAVALVALLGGIFGKKTMRGGKEERQETALRCSYDGTRLQPIYQVDAFLHDGVTASFCSIYCATRWFHENKDKVVYFTVVDEITGQRFDSTLGYFVKSDVVTIPEVKNRIHAFASKEDALTHAKQFNGKLLENPFGEAFVIPKAAQFGQLSVGAPLLPDSLPLRLAIFKPIFKENKLEVNVIPFRGEDAGKKLLAEGSVQAIICDLPSGLLLAKGKPSVRIIKNVLRANPYRALFALVAGPKVEYGRFVQEDGQSVALPKGVGFRFYAEHYFKIMDIPIDKVVIQEVDGLAEAWDLLNRGKVSAALLRTPYTDMALAKGMTFLADDRSLPWMSVLVMKQSVVEKNFEVVKRFIFGLEQSVLALNLKPDESQTFLEEQGGIPKEGRKGFPMPIFEGANAPSQDEIAPILQWLVEKGLLSQETTYQDLINAQFLPNPDDVGLAFCCR